jgi:ferrous iron transport protein A
MKRQHEHDRFIHPEIYDVTQVPLNTQYSIETVDSNDASLKQFLFTLGCYPKQRLTVISNLGDNYIIEIYGARYSIDKRLAKCIKIARFIGEI